jgi:hypothetical protein
MDGQPLPGRLAADLSSETRDVFANPQARKSDAQRASTFCCDAWKELMSGDNKQVIGDSARGLISNIGNPAFEFGGLLWNG